VGGELGAPGVTMMPSSLRSFVMNCSGFRRIVGSRGNR
jgi:hypothetical protein